MATYTGQDGSLSISGTAVAEVRSFSIDQTNNTVEKTVMGDSWKSYYTTQKEWSGSADIYYSQTSGNIANVAAITSGASAAFIGYPAGDTTGYPKLSGNILVTGVSISTSMDGMVEATISFQGDGALTVGTAT